MPNTKKRLLVVTTQECPCPSLVEEIARRDADEVHVVAPALNGRLAHWLSDVDGAIANARERLRGALVDVAAHAPTVTGAVGDSQAHVALDDALHSHRPDEILIFSDRAMPHWQERRLLDRAAGMNVAVVAPAAAA